MLQEVIPIDWERVLDFGPHVISILLYRTREAFNRPIRDLHTDVLGYEAVAAMERYPAAQMIPTILIGNAVEEADIPTRVNYDVFLSFPDDIDRYLPKIEELAHKRKTRSTISGYVCPACGGRLMFVNTPVRDLFCPRCGTAVSFIDDQTCTYTCPLGQSWPCTIQQLSPPHRPTEPA